MKNIAVITGDIIDSQKVAQDSYDNLLYTLETTLQLIVARFKGSKYDIYRGDSFQVMIPNIEDSILAALQIRLALKAEDKSFDARISIGIGQENNVRNDVRKSTGEAYLLSGTGIDKLKNQTFAIFSNNLEFQKKIELVSKYFDVNVSDLTQSQSKVMYKYFVENEKSHEQISSDLGTSRINTTKMLNKAKYQLIEEYIHLFTNFVEEID